MSGVHLLKSLHPRKINGGEYLVVGQIQIYQRGKFHRREGGKPVVRQVQHPQRLDELDVLEDAA